MSAANLSTPSRDRNGDRRFAIVQDVEDGMHLRRLKTKGAVGTLLYVHGLGESALSFEGLMTHPRLAQWNHLAPDLRGYGKSFWAAEPLSVEEQAEALASFLAAHTEESVVVLGHSMGGVIGTLLAEREPSRVRALVNVEGNISLADCGYSSQAARCSRTAWLELGMESVLDKILDDTNEAPAVRRAYGASIQFCDPRAFHRNSDDLVAFSSSRTLAQRMAALACPKVYLHGAPRGTGERSLGLLAAAEVQTVGIHDAGHWPFLDRPQLFVEALTTFLDGLPTPHPGLE